MNSTLPPQKVPWVDRINLFFKYRRYIKMLARRWPLMVLAIVIGTGIMVFRAMRAPNVYQAYSKIGVAPKISKPYSTGVQLVEEYNYFYENQIALLGSGDVLAKAEQGMRLQGMTNPPAMLDPQPGRDKGNLTMLVRSSDFDYAQKFSKEWARAFLEFKTSQREGLIGKSAQSTREEIIKYEKRLEKVRAEITEFQRKHNLASVKELGDAQQRQFDERNKEYQDLVTMRQRLENKSKEDLADGGMGDQKVVIREGDKRAAPIIESVDPLAKYLSDSNYSKYKRELNQHESDRERLSAILRDQHPYMQRLRAESDRLQDNIRYELEEIEGKRQARIRSLKIDEEALQPVLAELQKRLLESRRVATEFEKLKEDEQNVRGVLDRLNRQLQEIELTPTDESQFTILEEGIGSPRPVEPNRVKMVLTGLFAGLILGLGLVYFLDRLDDRLELAEEIEGALQEPVLGQLPTVHKERQTDSILVTQLDEHNLYSEALRGVRSAVLLGFQNERKKMLLSTSAVPGDGKTTFTMNFAVTLAIAGHRVLLIDADLRRGATHTFFGNNREPGFTDVLMGELHWTDVLRETPVETLKVIHTGKLPPNPGELLISPIPAQLVEEAKAAFDFVIFDCPPLTAIDDTFSLIPISDGVLFVVRSGQTSMRFAKNALHAIRQRGAQILGLVLNGITPDNPYYYYQKYYHGYYERGDRGVTAQKAMPVRKMAAPKSGRAHSIEELAKTYDAGGDAVTIEDSAAKAAAFKARRAAKQAAGVQPKPSAPDADV